MPASCADLSIGQCVDRQIRCVDHHWRFDGAGNCVDIPASDRIPPGAKLFSYPAAEASGLVWAFNGETPLFGVPRIPGIVEHDLAFEARLRGIGQVPPWVSTSNGVDFQQLRTLHNLPTSALKAVTVRDYMVEYRVEATGYMQYGLITGIDALPAHPSMHAARAVVGVWKTGDSTAER